MDQKTDGTLPGDFQKAAIHKQDVTLPLDSDVLAYIQGEYGDWKGHINDLLRFFMETSQRQMEFQPDAFEPGEMAAPQPVMELTLPPFRRTWRYGFKKRSASRWTRSCGCRTASTSPRPTGGKGRSRFSPMWRRPKANLNQNCFDRKPRSSNDRRELPRPDRPRGQNTG